MNDKDDRRRVRLIAPADLSGGYEFPVRLENGETYRVAVPAQGVQKGQTFVGIATRFVADEQQDESSTAYNDEDIHVVTPEMATAADPHHIPYGRFRDGLCACCRHGICHPLCFLSFCCTPCALGQVMTRLKLNHWGNPMPQNYAGQWTTFQVMTVIGLYFCICTMFLRTLANNYQVEGDYDDDDDADDADDFEINFDASTRNVWLVVVNILSMIVWLSFSIYMAIIICKTRRRIRRKYSIPSCCGSCSDCCCACCCACCVVCQIGRHTADYGEYEGYCCTDTGLGRGAPEIL